MISKGRFKKEIQSTILVSCLIAMQMDSLPLFAASRGLTVVSKEGKSIDLYKDYHAVVIGVSDYDYWPDLPNAVKDAQEIRAQLEKIGFTAELHLNPNAENMNSILANISFTLGRNERDRALLLYFAGHGETTELANKTPLGYIIPKDCPRQDEDPEGFYKKAISMQRIQEVASLVKSKHMLMIFDSCFSGSLFKLNRSPAPAYITEKIARPVRQFITAGEEHEQVPDMSIFKKCLIKALEGDADYHKDGYITGSELGMYLQNKVVEYTRKQQHPQFGTINDPDLDEGDFVFKLPGFEETVPKPGEEDKRFDTIANEREQEKGKWDEWQDAMEARYRKNQELDRGSNLTVSEKAQMWGQFLANYAANNPYSDSDDKMREDAKGRVEHWKGQYVNSKTEVNYNDPVVDMEFVWVPGGSFEMDLFGDGNGDEKHIRTVRLDGFWLGKYEVTQGEWTRIMGSNPSYFKKGDNYPVESVSWNDAQEFIKKLNSRYNGRYTFRLPSEAEWEYAARSGGKKERWVGTGDELMLGEYAWYGKNSKGSTHPVGQKRPNGLGLYDMAGNVWEWCEEYVRVGNYSKVGTTDIYIGKRDGDARVLRGGSWSSSFHENFRGGFRFFNYPVNHFNDYGFRVSRTP